MYNYPKITDLKRIFLILIVICTCLSSSAQSSSSFSVFFDVNSSKIDNVQLSNLITYLAPIPRESIFSISIVGYTDDTGTKEANAILSENRAASLLLILRNLDFPMHRLVEIKGKGIVPLVESSNKSAEEQRRFNRRVEIIIEKHELSRPSTLFKVPPKVGDIIILTEVHFKAGSHKLMPDSYHTLSELLFYLRENENFEITLLGHVCCIIIDEDAIDMETGLKNLSKARAEVVHDFLLQNGIDEERIKYYGMKAAFPLGEEEEKDRRVEIYVRRV